MCKCTLCRTQTSVVTDFILVFERSLYEQHLASLHTTLQQAATLMSHSDTISSLMSIPLIFQRDGVKTPPLMSPSLTCSKGY